MVKMHIKNFLGNFCVIHKSKNEKKVKKNEKTVVE